MQLYNISELQKDVDALMLKIGAPPYFFHLCSSPTDDGRPYISFDNGQYNYIISERGYEFSRKVTDSVDELLYWIIYDFVHSISVEYELENRIPNRDGRRIYFYKIVELMNIIKPEWGVKAQEDIDKILQDSPFDDSIY